MKSCADQYVSTRADECFCDQRGLGVKGVSCGDCPRDYARADAARPVLHFTGRADMAASGLRWTAIADRLYYTGGPWKDAHDREMSLRRTLRTGAAP